MVSGYHVCWPIKERDFFKQLSIYYSGEYHELKEHEVISERLLARIFFQVHVMLSREGVEFEFI